MKLIILILSLFVISIISNPQKLEIRNFEISPELLKKGSKVLISFEVFNPGPKDLPQNSFKMEVRLNGKLVSLDDASNPLKSKHRQPYSKEPENTISLFQKRIRLLLKSFSHQKTI
jgi:hypothetical protein